MAGCGAAGLVSAGTPSIICQPLASAHSVISSLVMAALKQRSGGLSRAPARRPGPLEIIAAQPTGNVHDLADEIEAGYGLGLHGLGVQRFGIDAAQGDLGGAVALG